MRTNDAPRFGGDDVRDIRRRGRDGLGRQRRGRREDWRRRLFFPQLLLEAKEQVEGEEAHEQPQHQQHRVGELEHILQETVHAHLCRARGRWRAHELSVPLLFFFDKTPKVRVSRGERGAAFVWRELVFFFRFPSHWPFFFAFFSLFSQFPFPAAPLTCPTSSINTRKRGRM